MGKGCISITGLICGAVLLVASVPSSALAAINYNSSKSNTGNYTFNPTDAAALQKCKNAGGKAVKQPDGSTLCVLPDKPDATPGQPGHN
jgi:hypothetical protein